MRITAVPLALLRFQYKVVRLPLDLVGQRVVARMDSEAPGRLIYERSLGALDAVVGAALRDPVLSQRGSALAERSDLLGRATRLDDAATRKEQHADSDLEAKRQRAAEDQKVAHARKDRGVEDALNAADHRQHAVADVAARQTAKAQQQVDEVATRRKESIETAKSEEQHSIRAAEQAATATADSALSKAQGKRDAATSKRAEADRVAKLADDERGKRQAGRVNDA
jgi:hypothetical protein